MSGNRKQNDTQHLTDAERELAAAYDAAEKLLAQRDSVSEMALAVQEAARIAAENEQLQTRLEELERVEIPAAVVESERLDADLKAAIDRVTELRAARAAAFAPRMQLNQERQRIIDMLKSRGVIADDFTTVDVQKKRAAWLRVVSGASGS